MSRKMGVSLAEHFAELEDPRVMRGEGYPLVNVIAVGVCAVICVAQHFTEMEEFGKSKRELLAKFLDLKRGIPSHDTFNAVFARLRGQKKGQALYLTGGGEAAHVSPVDERGMGRNGHDDGSEAFAG
jgi:hypothetical protein